MNIAKWDLLFISGVAIFIPAVRLAFNIPRKLDQMLIRLVHRGTLETTTERLSGLEKDLQKIANRWAKRTGILVALALLLAFFIAFGFPLPRERIMITVLEVIGGFIAGVFLGHMAGYGRLGWLFKQQRLTLKIQPGHIDGVAGLKANRRILLSASDGSGHSSYIFGSMVAYY